MPMRTILGGDPSPEDVKAALALSLQYEMEGLALLCEHYGIEQSDPTVRYILLALGLARDFVPYFQPASRQRGKKVDRVNGLSLAIDVANIKRGRPAMSDTQAVMHLDKGRLGRYAGREPESLRKSLHRARKDPFVAFCLRVAEDLPQYRKGGEGLKEMLGLARLLGRIT